MILRPVAARSATPGAPPFSLGPSTGWAVVAAVTLLGLVLRAIGIDGGLWWDEIRTLVDSARQPVHQIVTVYPGSNQHTFYSLLAHASIATFGEAPWSLRLPALLFGAATPPVLYLLARECTDEAEALMASLLLAVSYHHVWFSQNARGYAVLAFFTVLCTWLLLRGLRRGRLADFVAYGVAAGLGAFTHLTMVFVVVGHAVACLVAAVRPQWLPRPSAKLLVVGFASAGALTLLLYAPMLADLRQFFGERPTTMQGYTPRWAAAELLRGLGIGMGSLAIASAAGIAIVIGAWSYARRSPFVIALFVLPGLLTVVVSVLMARPVFPRFLFFLIGFAVLLLVRGTMTAGAWIAARHRAPPEAMRFPGLVLVACIAAASLWSLSFDYRYPKQDFGGALAFIEAHRPPGDPVVTAGGAMYPYRAYFEKPWPSVRSRDELQAVRAAGNPVWVVYTLPSYIRLPAPALWEVLSKECRIAREFRGSVAQGDLTVCVLPPPSTSVRSSP